MSNSFETPCTVAQQAPLSMGILRQGYGVGSCFLLQGIFPTQGLNPWLLHASRFSTTEPPGKSHNGISDHKKRMKYQSVLQHRGTLKMWCQVKEITYYIIPCIWNVTIGISIETENINRLVIIKGWRRGNWEVWGFLEGNVSVMGLDRVMVAQYYKYTKNQWIINFKRV